MAEGGNDVEIKFGASISDLKSKMDEVQGIFGKLTERFAVLAAVVAGGAAFKEFIDKTNELNAEATKLSKTLGITGEAAGTLNTALGDVGASADTYSDAFIKFNRQLRTNSESLKAMGVDVDAVKNGTKDSNQVFQEAIRIVGQYRPGVDQTQAAMRLLGRSAEDAQKLLKLFGGTAEETAHKLEEAAEKNKELNLTITKEGLKATKDYKAAINDVGDVMDGLKKTIGEAVIPIFTEMAQSLASIGPTLVEGTKAAVETFVAVWQTLRETVATVWGAISEILGVFKETWQAVFGEDGPGAMEIFKNALHLVQAAFIGFRVGVELIVEAVKTAFVAWGEILVRFGAVAERVMNFDFSGAKAAWQRGVADREKILQESAGRLAAIARKGQGDIEAALTGTGPKKTETPAGMPTSGGNKTMPLEDKGAGGMAAAKLALLKANSEASLALQEEALKEYQSQLDEAYSRNLVSDKDYYAAKLAGQLLSADALLEAKRKELADAKKAQGEAESRGGAKGGEESLKLQAEEAKLAGQINTLEMARLDTIRANTDAYKDAEAKRLDALNAIEANREKASADTQILTEKTALDQKLALHQISAEDVFAVQRSLEDRSYAATLKAQQDKADAIHGFEAAAQEERARLAAEDEALEAAHQQKLSTIDNQEELKRKELALQTQQSAAAGFEQMTEAMINGTLKLSDAFKNMGRFIEQTFVKLIAQKLTEQLFDAAGVNDAITSIVTTVTQGVASMVKHFILGETQKTAAERVGGVQRKALQAAETTSATTSVAITTDAAIIGQETQVAAVEAGTAVKIASDVEGSDASIAATAASAIFNIAAKAWEVAASVYSALAGIPYIGPFIAPVAAIAATAVVLSFAGRIHSSKGGEMQVGEDRLNFVHKDETILPARFAEGLRNLVEDGGHPSKSAAWQLPPNPLGQIMAQARATTPQGAGQGSGTSQATTVHLHVDAVDGASVKKLFMDNGAALAKALVNQQRNFLKTT